MSPADRNHGADPLETETLPALRAPSAAKASPALPAEGTAARLVLTLERAARLTLLESAIRRVEGRPWPAHHAERRFLRRWWRWLPAEDRQRPEARRLAARGRRMVRARLEAEAAAR